jgi:hypothetical protein
MQFCEVWQVLSVGLPWGGQQMRFMDLSQSLFVLHFDPTPPSPIPPSIPPLELELEPPLLEVEPPLLELELAPLLLELLPPLELELELEPLLLELLAPLEPELELASLPLELPLLLLVASPLPPPSPMRKAVSSPQAASPTPNPSKAAPRTQTVARDFEVMFTPLAQGS